MIGSVNHFGSGISRSVFFVRSDGQVWRRLFESCFHRGFGAVLI